MKRFTLFTAALALSGAAVAHTADMQTNPQQPTNPVQQQNQMPPTQTTPPANPRTTPQTPPAQGQTTQTQPAQGQTTMPSQTTQGQTRQGQTTQTQPAPGQTTMPSQTTRTQPMSGQANQSQQGQAAMPSGTTSGSGAAERDARGIAVISMPAEAPAGANQMTNVPAGAQVSVNPNQAQVFQPRQATEEFPPCTRERTDRCVQNYERGRTR